MRLQGQIYADMLYTQWDSISDTPSLRNQRPSVEIRDANSHA